MPWTPEDAQSHDKKADSPLKRRMWAHVANSELKRTGDDAAAVRAANGVLKKRLRGKK